MFHPVFNPIHIFDHICEDIRHSFISTTFFVTKTCKTNNYCRIIPRAFRNNQRSSRVPMTTRGQEAHSNESICLLCLFFFVPFLLSSTLLQHCNSSAFSPLPIAFSTEVMFSKFQRHGRVSSTVPFLSFVLTLSLFRM